MTPKSISTSAAAPQPTPKPPTAQSGSGSVKGPKLDTPSAPVGARARVADRFETKPGTKPLPRPPALANGGFVGPRRDGFETSRPATGARPSGLDGFAGAKGQGSKAIGGLTPQVVKGLNSANSSLGSVIAGLTGKLPTSNFKDPSKTLLSFSKQILKLSKDPATQQLGQQMPWISDTLNSTADQLSALLGSTSGRVSKRIEKSITMMREAACAFRSPIQDNDMVP